jgi:hypothetical protein
VRTENNRQILTITVAAFPDMIVAGGIMQEPCRRPVCRLLDGSRRKAGARASGGFEIAAARSGA